MGRAVRVLASCLLLGACQSSSQLEFELPPEACSALAAWAEQGAVADRVVSWDWNYGRDVIGMRARMVAGPTADHVADEYDLALYDGLSRYTHSVALGEFAWAASRCFGTEAEVRMGEYGFVEYMTSSFEHAGAQIDVSFFEDRCAFRATDELPGSSGCASFRSRPDG